MYVMVANFLRSCAEMKKQLAYELAPYDMIINCQYVQSFNVYFVYNRLFNIIYIIYICIPESCCR